MYEIKYNHINSGTQKKQKNMKEAVKRHMLCASSNNDRRPVPKSFTPLHKNGTRSHHKVKQNSFISLNQHYFSNTISDHNDTLMRGSGNVHS